MTDTGNLVFYYFLAEARSISLWQVFGDEVGYPQSDIAVWDRRPYGHSDNQYVSGTRTGPIPLSYQTNHINLSECFK